MKLATTIMLTAALGVLGCKKDEAKKAPPGTGTGATASNKKPGKGMPTKGDCDNLGKKTSEMSMQQTPPGTTDEQRKQLQAMSDEAGAVIARRCMEDGWSGEAVSCGLTEKDPSGCNKLLTDDQRSKMETEVQAIFAKGMQAMGEPPAAAGLSGIATCDDLIKLVVATGSCDKLDDETKQSAPQMLEMLRGQLEKEKDPMGKEEVSNLCQISATSLRGKLDAVGCKP